MDNKMNHQEKLRDLSQRLDIHFGVDVRKSVMLGHESLTPATSENRWSQWISEVAARLDSLTDADPVRKLTDLPYIRRLIDNSTNPESVD